MTPWTAVFLDRDGTINRAPDPTNRYLRRAEELELLPGAADAIALLNDAGIWVGVVTNQRGVSRGDMTLADVGAIHDRLESELDLRGAHLDAIYVCPHIDTTCGCRKPEPGMLDRAFAEHPHLSRRHSLLVGDQATDMECADRAGVTGIRLIEPGNAPASSGLVALSLADAVYRFVDARVAR